MAIAAIPELSIFIVFPLRALHGRHLVADPHPLGVPANDCGALHEEIAVLGLRLHPVKHFIGRAAQGFVFLGDQTRSGVKCTIHEVIEDKPGLRDTIDILTIKSGLGTR